MKLYLRVAPPARAGKKAQPFRKFEEIRYEGHVWSRIFAVG